MRNRSRKGQTLALVWFLGVVSLVAGESAVSGRLTDARGAAIPGATVLVFPAGMPDGLAGCAGAARAAGRTIDDTPPCALLRTNLDGGFVVLLPPGRYMVAAVKQGYEVSISEIHSLVTRILRMRLESSAAEAGPPRAGRARVIDWALRGTPNDILKTEDAAMTPAFVLLAGAPAGAAPPVAPPSAPPAPTALLGTLDGEVTQSLTAGDLPGMDSASVGDAGRATTLALRAPVDERLAWSFAGASARAEAGLTGTGATMTGGSDRMIAGAEYGAAADTLRGVARAGVGRALGGSAEVRDRLLAAAGSITTNAGADPIEVAVQAWSARADLGAGDFVTLDGVATGVAAAPVSGGGLSVYAGSHHDFGAATALRYGVEYRDDSLGGGARVVPRVGMSHTLAGAGGVAFSGEVLLDPGSPGGSVGIQSGTADTLRIAAMVAVMPEFAPAAATMTGGPAAAAAGPMSALSAGRRSVDVSLARDFGPLGGSVSGSLGRTDRRSMPAIEDAPMPIVSLGAERYYETRIGVAWRPSATEMQLGYRRVEAEPVASGAASGGDYGRIDFMVSQGLPAPRALNGARLRALVAWQGVTYDALLAGNGAPVSGIASRLSGGVGLSF